MVFASNPSYIKRKKEKEKGRTVEQFVFFKHPRNGIRRNLSSRLSLKLHCTYEFYLLLPQQKYPSFLIMAVGAYWSIYHLKRRCGEEFGNSLCPRQKNIYPKREEYDLHIKVITKALVLKWASCYCSCVASSIASDQFSVINHIM